MKRLLVRRGAAGLALGALAATGLTSLAAPADAAVGNPSLSANSGFHNDMGTCTPSSNQSDPADVPWSDNGFPVSLATSEAGTVTNDGNPADVTDVKSSAVGTVTAGPFTGGATTIKLTGGASASAIPRLGASSCDAHVSAYASAEGEYTLTQPMWATITVTSSGSGSASISGGVSTNDSENFLSGGSRGKGTLSLYLPAGKVWVSMTAGAEAHGRPDGTHASTVSGGVTIDLVPAGTGSAVTSKAKGKRYVGLGSRDCATGNVAAAVTKKAKKSASQITFKVNGAKVAGLKGKKIKKRTLALAAPKVADVTVTAKIKLKNGMRAEVSRDYLGC